MAIPIAVILTVLGGYVYDTLNQHPHVESTKARCASNLHQIGLGILLYQNDNDQHYPPSLAEVVAEGISPQQLICYGSNDTAAEGSKPTTRQAAEFLAKPGHCSYVYLGHADWTGKTVPDDAVVAYDPPAHHENDGSEILFGNGHAEWIANPPRRPAHQSRVGDDPASVDGGGAVTALLMLLPTFSPGRTRPGVGRQERFPRDRNPPDEYVRG